MHRRLLLRCALASVGALAVFTAALAMPAPSRSGIHAQAVDACMTVLGQGVQPFGERARVVSVSIVAGHRACLSGQDGRCWNSALLRACVVKASIR